MKRRELNNLICILLAVILCCSLLVGCGNKAGDQTITLTIWHVYGEQSDSPLNDLIDEFFPVFLIQLAVPGQLGCLFHNSVLQSHECSIIGYHLLLLSAMRLQFLILGCVHGRQIVISILCKNHDTFLTILYCTKSEGIFIELL